jgi:hypothetical protein
MREAIAFPRCSLFYKAGGNMSQMEMPSRPFLLMEGGPFFNLQKRVGLIRQNSSRVKRRAVLAALITWIPLLMLASLQHRAFGHSVPVPFMSDFSAHSRFIFAIPLLILAENILGPRIAGAAAHFVDSGLVVEKDYRRFDQFVADGLRSRDSIPAELIAVVLAYCLAIISFRLTAVHMDTWYATRSDQGTTLTWAGWWLLGFCTPLFHFLLLRWVWRIILWFQFLARARKLDLQLFPTHPDEAGGLGFVGDTQRLFGILLFAFSLASVGVLANDIVYDKIPLQAFVPAFVTYAVAVLIVFAGPLAIFSGMLRRLKRLGLHQYGTLATAYAGSFHKKWIENQNSDHEALLGTGDIQSLADLGNSYSFVKKMKAIPIDPLDLVHLIVASLLPMTPLLLTVMPLGDLLKILLKVLA